MRPIALARIAACIVFGAALTPSIRAEVLVVDPSGAGDFTSVSAAVSAAAENDVILVLPGQYVGFFTSKALTLLGEPGASLGSSIVSDLGPTQHFRISGLEISELALDDCAGTVLVDDYRSGLSFSSAPFIATGCADVRVQRSSFVGDAVPVEEVVEAVEVSDSRIQLVSCDLRAEDGPARYISSPAGPPGLRASSSTVHLARTDVFGGDGIPTFDCAFAEPGVGGPGIHGLLATLIVAGDGSSVSVGGDSGTTAGSCGASGGAGVHQIGGSLRHGGVLLQGGASTPSGSAPPVTGNGTELAVVERDPVLELLDTPRAGATVRIRAAGEPGSSVVLHAGRQAVLVSDPVSTIERLTSEERSRALGILPASGELFTTLEVPQGVGRVLWLQATSVSPTGDIERSNSISLLVRPAR